VIFRRKYNQFTLYFVHLYFSWLWNHTGVIQLVP
jgi:hypothetical protein